MKKTEQMEILCFREISGQISTDEKQQLEKWLSESTENRRQFDSLKQTWDQTAEPQEEQFSADVDSAWKQFENSYLSSEESKESGFSVLIAKLAGNRFKPAFAIAFTVILIAVIVWGGLQQLNFMTTIQVARGERETVQLPDGSTVMLNADSELRYSSKHFSSGKRELALRGEAFFDVQSAEGATFSVKTEHGTTTVLGTQFNVLDRGEKTRVVVKEGLVQLEANGFVRIRGGEMSWVEAGSNPADPQSIDISDELAWLDRRFVFNRTPFSHVIETLNRQFDVNITLKDDRLKNRKLTAEFEKQSLDSILQYVCLAFQTRYVKKEKTYQVGISE